MPKLKSQMTEEEFLDYELNRGELAFVPEDMFCYSCRVDKKVVKLGRVVNEADPTQTYMLECGHVTI